MTLEHLGWGPFFTHDFGPFESLGYTPARIIRQDRTGFSAQQDGSPFRAVPAGALHQAPGDLPVTGDWVAIDGERRIRAVLTRKTAFSRKEPGRAVREQVIVANIDVAFLVSSLDDDFSLRRIERYVAQTWSSGIRPVVVLNKIDLHPDPDAVKLRVEGTVPGVEVQAMSALSGGGCEAIRPYLTPGSTAVFLGSSGVGKSTLLNGLLGREVARTSAVREEDSKGRHTTTHRELFVLPGGGIVIDTPGLRELQLWAPAESLDDSFADIEELAWACRYRDCSHEREPGCAVRAAVEEGELDAARLNNFRKMKKELEYLERRREDSYRQDERRHGREMSRLLRERLRQKGR